MTALVIIVVSAAAFGVLYVADVVDAGQYAEGQRTKRREQMPVPKDLRISRGESMNVLQPRFNQLVKNTEELAERVARLEANK